MKIQWISISRGSSGSMAPLSVEDLEQAVAAALQAQVPPAQGGSQRSFTKQKKGLKHGDFTWFYHQKCGANQPTIHKMMKKCGFNMIQPSNAGYRNGKWGFRSQEWGRSNQKWRFHHQKHGFNDQKLVIKKKRWLNAVERNSISIQNWEFIFLRLLYGVETRMTCSYIGTGLKQATGKKNTMEWGQVECVLLLSAQMNYMNWT